MILSFLNCLTLVLLAILEIECQLKQLPDPIVTFYGQRKYEIDQQLRGREKEFTAPPVPFSVENSEDFQGSNFVYGFELKGGGSFEIPGEYPIIWTLYLNDVAVYTAPEIRLTVNDINECLDPTLNVCNQTESTCENTIGSYYCKCKTGFRSLALVREENRGCEDINECTENIHNCDINAICENTHGSFICKCKTGYEKKGERCEDIDECKGLNECHRGADCINDFYREDLGVGYYCECRTNEGWVGDGKNCIPLSTCPSNHKCPMHSICKPDPSEPGLYKCQCHTGFREVRLLGGGLLCEDINECLEIGNLCKHPTQCYNTIGGYECRCAPDWISDGPQCRNIACSKHKCPDGEICHQINDNPYQFYICECAPNFKRNASGVCLPNLASFGRFPPSEIKQCQSIQLNFPQVTISGDVKIYYTVPHQLLGLYVKDVTQPNQPLEIRVNMTDRWDRLSVDSLKIHVKNLDECSVPDDKWTTDPNLLRDPNLQFFHADCKPNCTKMCDVRFPECARCRDDKEGSYSCECNLPDWRFDGRRCVDNRPPRIIVNEGPINLDDCMDCNQLKDGYKPPTCGDYMKRFPEKIGDCIVKDNFDVFPPTCQRICNYIPEKEFQLDGKLFKSFYITNSATDSSGNKAREVRQLVNVEIMDFRNTFRELARLSESDSMMYMTILSFFLGILIVLLIVFGRRAVNMFAYLLGAGMNYPAFEEGGSLWLSISRWWWTENERRQFLLTQWALKRE